MRYWQSCKASQPVRRQDVMRSITSVRYTKCLRADHLPGAGIEKVQMEGTWGPCRRPIRSGPLLKTAYKFARGPEVRVPSNVCARMSGAEENSDGRLSCEGEGYS